MMIRASPPLLVAAFFLAPAPLRADEAPDYLRQVKPLLAAKCFACHGALQQKGGPPRRAEPPVSRRQVKPRLAAKCFPCHGALQQKGGLRLDSVKSMREGGD